MWSEIIGAVLHCVLVAEEQDAHFPTMLQATIQAQVQSSEQFEGRILTYTDELPCAPAHIGNMCANYGTPPTRPGDCKERGAARSRALAGDRTVLTTELDSPSDSTATTTAPSLLLQGQHTTHTKDVSYFPIGDYPNTQIINYINSPNFFDTQHI